MNILSFAASFTISGLIALFIQVNSAKASPIELTCRSKAKDIAVKVYETCVTKSRNQKIEEIRKEYQGKLNELKSYYDRELKALDPQTNSTSKNSSVLPVQQSTTDQKNKKSDLRDQVRKTNKNEGSSSKESSLKTEIQNHVNNQTEEIKPTESVKKVEATPVPTPAQSDDEEPELVEIPAPEDAR